jgi:hypothetical protein
MHRYLSGYRLPNPCDTHEDALRLDNIDLDQMGAHGLHAERWRLQRLLTAPPDRLGVLIWAVDVFPLTVGQWAWRRLILVEERLNQGHRDVSS